MANTALIEDLLRQFSENPRRVFARLANELRKSGDYDRAIEICRAQIPHQPGYISGHIVLGQSLYDSGRLEEARQSFETALNLDPENLIALRHLGDIARQHGENDVAKGWYRRLLEVDPQNDEVTAQLEAMGAAPPAPPEQSGFVEGFAPTVDLEALGATAASPEAQSQPGASPVEASGKARPSDAVAAHEPLEIETADAFEPTAGAEKAFPELEQSLEVSGLTPEETGPRVAAQSTFGDAILDQARREKEGEPRDAVDAYYPMLDVQASSPAPAAFVTETMAELYLQQGYTQEALEIYRQLAAQNPADESLRGRVRQLEQGSRSSVGIAAISDEVVEAAHKRATAKPKKTIRSFFAKLAMRRVVEREAAPARGQGGTDDQEPDEYIGARRVNEPPVIPPPPTRTAPELEEPAWLRSDPEPEPPPTPPSVPQGGGPFALLDEVDWNAAMPRTPGRGAEPPEPPTPKDEVPWLAGYEPVAATPSPPAAPEPPSGGEPLPLILPPSELFPTETIQAEDENAAATLASAFEPEFAARLTPVHPMASQPPRPNDSRPRTPASATPATREAEEDLSLDQVFGRTPSSGPAQRRSGFTFDQFFDEQNTTAQTGEGSGASSEIELFNTWLDQLKK